jgi:hypothetical protein
VSLIDHRILLSRVLLTAYGAYLQPTWFTLDAYLWTVELWYAYAIQVRLRGTEFRQVCSNSCRQAHCRLQFAHEMISSDFKLDLNSILSPQGPAQSAQPAFLHPLLYPNHLALQPLAVDYR